ncbi:hypothetical protein L873DRAFT_1138607 [Choiromyces venosus 120613-1]|uniref:Uncharacterized protein n=1 Tax=Choiromyces venosus 120613-1 TaxID=1336337 RepID=A0A3N4JKE9_9PEZI|nr:hypothetical protein L873DRAFT_1138607 [Choiromyces venosus 120613-1]
MESPKSWSAQKQAGIIAASQVSLLYSIMPSASFGGYLKTRLLCRPLCSGFQNSKSDPIGALPSLVPLVTNSSIRADFKMIDEFCLEPGYQARQSKSGGFTTAISDMSKFMGTKQSAHDLIRSQHEQSSTNRCLTP